MSSETKRKKNKSKYQHWEEMDTAKLISMLGKRGRAKSIRCILRKRIEAMNALVSAEDKIPLDNFRKGLPLSMLKTKLEI